MALADYDLKFPCIGVGSQGRRSDRGVYNNSGIKEAILMNLTSLFVGNDVGEYTIILGSAEGSHLNEFNFPPKGNGTSYILN